MEVTVWDLKNCDRDNENADDLRTIVALKFICKIVSALHQRLKCVYIKDGCVCKKKAINLYD